MTLGRTTRTTTRPARADVHSDRLSREILVLAAVVILGTIMTVLDLTVVNVAIPTLGSDLGAPIPAIQWVLTGYMLAFATMIPVTGWTAERFGAKRVWLTALLLFLAGSVLAGAAWSAGSLIAFRVVQGLGAGMILPVGQTILAQAAGPQRMGRVMSVIGVPMLLAPVFGPVIGGAIIGAASWRWIFFINLPVGLAALVLCFALLHDPPYLRDMRAQLLSKADEQVGAIGSQLLPFDREQFQLGCALVRAELEPDTCAAAWETGPLLSLDEALRKVEALGQSRPAAAGSSGRTESVGHS